MLRYFSGIRGGGGWGLLKPTYQAVALDLVIQLEPPVLKVLHPPTRNNALGGRRGGEAESFGGEQQSVATPQTARGWARPRTNLADALGLLSRWRLLNP